MRLTRRGFSMVEVLVALVLTSVLGAALFRLLDRSHRFARGIALVADQRAQLAVAGFAVEGELQGIATSDSDVIVASDSSVTYLAHVGSALVCSSGSGIIDVAPTTIASGATLTWWNTSPQVGDSLAVFDEGASAGATDDRWFRAAVSGLTLMSNACLHTPYLDSIADAGTVGWRLRTSPSLPPTVTPGAVVRILRPERFGLYRSSGEWMVGWSEWNPSAGSWNVIQPVAGPLLPYAPSGGSSGLSLRWLDSLGVAVIPTAGVAARAIDLSLFAVTRQAVRMDGVARGLRRDSLFVRIPLRNAP